MFLLSCPFVSGAGERKVEQGLLLPNGAPRSTALYAVPPTGICHRNRKKR